MTCSKIGKVLKTLPILFCKLTIFTLNFTRHLTNDETTYTTLTQSTTSFFLVADFDYPAFCVFFQNENSKFFLRSDTM